MTIQLDLNNIGSPAFSANLFPAFKGLNTSLHSCFSAPLARLEASVALQIMFERAPNLRLTASPKYLEWVSSLVRRGVKAMPVTF